MEKINEPESVFSDFPFGYMDKEEQLILLHHIMTSLPERQIMANMKKTDVDRYYMNFVYRNNNDILNQEIFEEEFKEYFPINLFNEILQCRCIIRYSPEDETLTGWGLDPEKTYSFKGEYLEEQKMVVFCLKTMNL